MYMSIALWPWMGALLVKETLLTLLLQPPPCCWGERTQPTSVPRQRVFCTHQHWTLQCTTAINQHTHTAINVYWTTINQCIELLSINIHILNYYQSMYTYWTHCPTHKCCYSKRSKAPNWDFDVDDNDNNVCEHFWNVGSSCPYLLLGYTQEN